MSARSVVSRRTTRAAAVAGGAMPEPGSPAPPELDALVAFARLALDAACAHVLGTHWRAEDGG